MYDGNNYIETTSEEPTALLFDVSPHECNAAGLNGSIGPAPVEMPRSGCALLTPSRTRSFPLQLPNRCGVFLWQHLREHTIDSERSCDGVRGLLIIAGNHDGADATTLKLVNGSLRVRFQRVGSRNETSQPPMPESSVVAGSR